jgi:hypothetical protein
MFCNLLLLLLFPTRLVGDLFVFSDEDDEEEEEAFLSTFEGRKTGWLSQSVAVGDDEGDEVDVIFFFLRSLFSIYISFSRMID